MDGTHEVEMEVIDDGPASPLADNEKVKVKRSNDPCAWPKTASRTPAASPPTGSSSSPTSTKLSET